MVAAVHSWSDKDPLESVLDAEGNSQVAVMELGRNIKKNVKRHQPPERGSPEENHQAL